MKLAIAAARGHAPPSDADIEFRQGLIRAFEEGAAAGHGAVRYRGIHIDKAHADTARDWLAYAERVRTQGDPSSASGITLAEEAAGGRLEATSAPNESKE